MGIKDKWLRYNPISRNIIRKKRDDIKGHEPTILASNCLGGLLYHTYGLKFNSPLINTRVNSKEFIKLIVNFNHYIYQPLTFIETKDTYPVAKLDDITIHFVHYHSKEEAQKKWMERLKRMNLDNTFIILNDCDGVNEKDLILLNQSIFKNILVFTANHYPHIQSTFQLSIFSNQPCVGNTMLKDWITGEMVVEKYFNFSEWFKQTKGSLLEYYRINN